MRHHHYLIGILTFIFVGVLLSFSQNVKISEAALNLATKKEIALYVERKTAPQSAVLGSSTEDINSILLKASQRSSVIDLTRENNIVIVEHTDDGDIVKAIGQIGFSDIDRESRKSWHFTVNGKRYDIGSDRVMVNSGDIVAWYYE